MNRFTLSLVCSGLLLLTSCGAEEQPQTSSGTVQQEVQKPWEVALKPFDQKQYYELRGTSPFLLYFTGDQCATCDVLNPALEAEGNKLNGKITLMRADFDTEMELRKELNVALPGTMVAFDTQGGVYLMQSYLVTFAQVQEMINAVLPSEKK